MKGWAPCVFPSKMVGSWWAPCVFPGKMVGSWWVPCVFPSKMVGSWWAPGGFLVFFQVKWWAPGGFLVFFQVKWWAPGKLLAFFQVKWWHSGGFLVFFQVKWWAPGGLLVFFQVKWDPRGWSSNGFFVGTFGCHIAIFLDNPDGPKFSATCHVQKFWRKAGPQQYWKTGETAIPLCSFFGNGRNSHFLFAFVALLVFPKTAADYLFSFRIIALFVCWDGRNSHLSFKKKNTVAHCAVGLSNELLRCPNRSILRLCRCLVARFLSLVDSKGRTCQLTAVTRSHWKPSCVCLLMSLLLTWTCCSHLSSRGKLDSFWSSLCVERFPVISRFAILCCLSSGACWFCFRSEVYSLFFCKPHNSRDKGLLVAIRLDMLHLGATCKQLRRMRPVESLQPCLFCSSRRVACLHPWVSVSTFLIRSSLIADLYFALGGECLLVSRRLRGYLQTNDGIATRSWCAGCARRGVPLLQQLSFANHFTLRFTFTSLSFTLEKIAVVSPWCYTFALWWECDRLAILLPLW